MTTYEKESRQILQTLQYIFDGIDQLDREMILKAFHPRARVYNTSEDCVEGVPVNVYAKRFISALKGEGSPDFQNPIVDKDVIAVNIAGDAAAVKMEWVFTTVKVTEYYTFLKLAGMWLIVSKAWSRQERD